MGREGARKGLSIEHELQEERSESDEINKESMTKSSTSFTTCFAIQEKLCVCAQQAPPICQQPAESKKKHYHARSSAIARQDGCQTHPLIPALTIPLSNHCPPLPPVPCSPPPPFLAYLLLQQNLELEVVYALKTVIHLQDILIQGVLLSIVDPAQ